MTKRQIIVGDIHGCFQEFTQLLNKLNYNSEKDVIISVGDLIDKGPYIHETVEWFRKTKSLSVLGNHECKFMRYRIEKRGNPSEQRINEYNVLTDEDLSYIRNLPYYLKLEDNYLIVHAGLEPRLSLESQIPKVMTMVRFVNDAGKFIGGIKQQPDTYRWPLKYHDKYNVIYVHIANDLEKPMIDNCVNATCYGIDCGSVYGGNLIGFILQEKEFVSVKCNKYSEFFT